MRRKPPFADFTARDIARLTRLIRKMLRVHDQKAPNLLVLFEQLKRVFPKLRLRIVEDADMPGAEARAYPSYWIIKIRKGILEGLLRGDAGARWTLAHELGHVLLQHPGRPFRKRGADSNFVEEQAHSFAAQMLAPFDLVKRYRTAEEIALVFHLSAEAARRRLSESQLEHQSEKIGARRTTTQDRGNVFGLENLAATIFDTISISITESKSSAPVEPWRNNLFCTSLAVATAAHLLMDAYESVRPTIRENKFVSASCVAAAILTINPLREIGTSQTQSREVTKLNEQCALRMAASLLNLDLERWEDGGGQGTFREAGISFNFDYLTSFIQRAEMVPEDSSPVAYFKSLPNYFEYNGGGDISWLELHKIDHFAKMFSLWATCHKR
jgi:Zn-dependent peptidase ImmA (M78 family)